ncbi:M48 family metallopeptidase [Myxosarcina sp. GI1]|uniref:M48 family metallopeptidase n=1 Tax=Myxosarcina sp. GI1 TaxID=1541065 RepID=UPI00068F3C9F|nr:M48 family metallopeptidase [Myxosarcina sp. GI1]
MFNFKNNLVGNKKNQNYSKVYQIPLIFVGVFSAIAPLEAKATSLTKEKQIDLSSRTVISLDLLDLFKNAVRYVQISSISNEEEVEIGKQINQKLLNQQYQLFNNTQIQEYVDNIGQELVASSDSRDIPYTFQVVASDTVNAFATPGGFVYVTSGLVEEADNQAQLASVIAHEIAHINQRHSIENLKQAVIAQGIAETAGVNTNTLAQIGYQLAIDLPQSREYEYEADRVGLEILQQADYPPIAFVNFLEQLEGGGQPEFLRTHPTNSNRIEALTKEIKSAEVQ